MQVHAIRETTSPTAHRGGPVIRPVFGPPGRDQTDAESFRQLRHLTKNTLQKVLSMIACAPDIQDAPCGRSLSEDLQDRILASAQLSNALFGLTHAPGNLADRLWSVAQASLQLLGDSFAEIDIVVNVQCAPCAEREDLLVRVAHELIGNAIKHGMHQRLLGTITITVQDMPNSLVLTVADNGWGCATPTENTGEGLSIVNALLRRAGGTFNLRRTLDRTIASVTLPRR